jgi:hypothetical protein
VALKREMALPDMPILILQVTWILQKLGLTGV